MTLLLKDVMFNKKESNEKINIMSNSLFDSRRNLSNLIDEIIDTIEKDGLPINNKGTITTISNSPNVAFNNIGITTQTITIISDFNKYYNEAINEIKGTDKLNNEEKEELTDLLSDIKLDIDKQEQPKKSLLRSLAKYSEKIITIGGSLATLYQVL